MIRQRRWYRVRLDMPCKLCGGQRWFRQTIPFTYWCTTCDGELPP